MGRRSWVSATTIKRIIAANNRMEREEYNKRLIESNMGDAKELPLEYKLENVDFDLETRVAKIVFSETKKYRTIERYITQNYVRHPIYSEWKTKTKKIYKTIKLTNSELETLDTNEDSLISQFANQIVIGLEHEDLFPSWFVLNSLEQEYREEVEHINNSFRKIQIEKQNSREAINQKIHHNVNDIEQQKYRLQICLKSQTAIECKIAKYNQTKKSLFLSIISFGIYAYYTSKKRKNSLDNKLIALKKGIHSIEQEISHLDNRNIALFLEQNALDELLEDKRKEKDQWLAKAQELYASKMHQVTPLQSSYDRSDEFTLLRNIGGLEYTKIVGCYIIHNRENDKYYVGQSKDVLKRLKQHFRGTVPHNIIFAEDYYSSSFSNKDELFEVKIIPCDTKDELDAMERKLIEQYDAWGSGYNGTSGNN